MAVGVVAAGCAGSPQPSAQQPPHHRGTTTTRAPATTSSTVSSTTTSTASAPATTTTSRPSGPGVLADCTSPPPQHLEVEPSSITVACADAGIGAQDLVWLSWTDTMATASGDVWENDCTPSCAAGTIKHYPASITLSDVQTSRDGPTFTAMTATYSGPEPNGHPTDTFGLQQPLG
jgi:hypothetical protein